MRGQLPTIPIISLIFCGLLSACLRKQSADTDKDSAQQLAEEPGAAHLAEISLNPATIRANLEKVFEAESSCPATPDVSGHRQLRLLTRDEYNRSVKDLFKLYADYRSFIPLEQKVLGFRNNSQFALVSSDHAAAYDKTAKELAQQIVGTEWPRLMKCEVAAGSSCAETFIRTFGPRIWRRPLSGTEIQSLLKVHEIGSAISPAAAMELLVRALLVSPHFLYRSETGENGKLTSYELASALSYFFWGTTPDDELLKIAADGGLLQDSTLLQQAERLLKDQRAKEGMKAFADSWLNYTAVQSVNKDFNRYPQFDFNIRSALAQETEDFFDYAVRNKQVQFPELLNADYSIGDQRLADYYQAQLTVEGDLSRLRFPGQARVGILGHGSILASLAYATETGPIQRGKFVREHLLCDILTPPPPNLMIKPPAPKEGATTRERFAEHTSAPACRGCHVKIDGVGFAMEDFDAIGLMRDTDNGKPVDASGQIYALDGKNLDINGGKELSLALAQSPRAKACFVVQTWRMAQGRLETADDVCALRQLTSRFHQQNLNIAQLLVQMITDPSYIKRSL